MSKQDRETIKLLQDSLKSANETNQLLTNLYLSEQKEKLKVQEENRTLKSLITKKRK